MLRLVAPTRQITPASGALTTRRITGPGLGRRGYAAARGTSVSMVASGRQANRAGAQGEVPRPADTCSQARFPSGAGTSADGCWLRPLTRGRSMEQLVTRAP